MNAKAQHICREHSLSGICVRATCPLGAACEMHKDDRSDNTNFSDRMNAAAAEVVVGGWE